MKNGSLYSKSTTEKIFYFFLICLLGKLLFSGLSFYACSFFFNINLHELSGTKILTINAVRAYKTAAVFDQLGTFLFPALLFCYLFGKSPTYYLNLNPFKKKLFLILPITLTVMYICSFALIEINTIIDFSFLGESLLNRFLTSQEFLEKIHYSFIGVSPINLIGCLFIMALLPALCEEFVFRGILQHLFSNWFKSVHIGVVFSAIIFAVLHFQFFNLLALLFIGVLLGYIVCLTNNLWTSILLHFFYNLTSLLTIFLEKKSMLATSIVSESVSIYIPIIILLLCLFLLVLIFRKNHSFALIKEKYRH